MSDDTRPTGREANPPRKATIQRMVREMHTAQIPLHDDIAADHCYGAMEALRWVLGDGPSPLGLAKPLGVYRATLSAPAGPEPSEEASKGPAGLDPLPRCGHGSPLLDGAGEILVPSCGCRYAVDRAAGQPDTCGSCGGPTVRQDVWICRACNMQTRQGGGDTRIAVLESEIRRLKASLDAAYQRKDWPT